MSRVVMFVYNDCTRDARVLREAAALAAAGHRVTIMARPRDAASATGDREERDGFEIVRVPIPNGWRRRWAWAWYPWRTYGWLGRWVAFRVKSGIRRPPRGWVEIVVILVGLVAWVPWAVIRTIAYAIARLIHPERRQSTVEWLVRWRYGIAGWARAAADAAPDADVWHGHDLSGFPGADRGAARMRAAGVFPRIVYDSHELFLESGSNARRPAWGKRVLSRMERRLSKRADALVTVNRTLAEALDAEYGPFPRVVVIHNAPARWDPPAERPDHLRQALGLGPDVPVVLYHGGFSPDRGLVPLAEAMLAPGLERAHLAYVGFGGMTDELVALSAEPRFGGRIHVLPAVSQEDLPAWVASADVGVMPNQPTTANERLSTPNKLFESLAAGIPVVTSDYPERRRIVIDDPDGPLGETCDPTDPMSIGEAIRRIVDLDPAAYADLRRRCLRAAHERWNWETEAEKLVALYADLATAP